MALRQAVPGVLGIGGVAQQRQNSLLSVLGQSAEIRSLFKDRCVVDLEVAGVYDHSRRSGDGQRGGIRDGMVDSDEFYVKAAEVYGISRMDRVEQG